MSKVSHLFRPTFRTQAENGQSNDHAVNKRQTEENNDGEMIS